MNPSSKLDSVAHRTEAFIKWLFRYHNSYQRPHALLDSAQEDVFWPVVADAWCSFDGIPHAAYERAFAKHRALWSPDIMCAEDRAAYDALPDSFIAYRGQDEAAPVGLSWTLEESVAQEFARGYRCDNTSPVVLRRKVRKEQVVLACVGRDEAEVVLFRVPRMNSRMQVTRIEPRPKDAGPMTSLGSPVA